MMTEFKTMYYFGGMSLNYSGFWLVKIDQNDSLPTKIKQLTFDKSGISTETRRIISNIV